MMLRPRELTLGGAAGAASGNARITAAAPLDRFDLGLLEGGREAFRLVGGAFCIAFVVF
jgi:hypothetical protein